MICHSLLHFPLRSFAGNMTSAEGYQDQKNTHVELNFGWSVGDTLIFCDFDKMLSGNVKIENRKMFY